MGCLARTVIFIAGIILVRVDSGNYACLGWIVILIALFAGWESSSSTSTHSSSDSEEE